MRTRFVVLIALVGIAIMGCTSPATAEPQVVAAMSDNATVQPTVSLTPEPTETTLPTATIVATATASPTATTQATPTPAPTETSTPTATPEPTATERVPDLSKYGLIYDPETKKYYEGGEYRGQVQEFL